MSPQELCAAWLQAKHAEQQAVERRRMLEDELSIYFGVKPTDDGTQNHDAEQFAVKIICTPNRKVDGDLVKQIAIENDAGRFVETLFRWKPELSLTAWKNTDSSITALFAPAITTKASRPSYTIVAKGV